MQETQPTPTDTDAGTSSQDHLTKNSSPPTHDPSANGVQVSPTAVASTASHHPKNEERDTGCTGTDGHLDSIGLNAINPSEPHMTTSTSGGSDESNSEPIVDGEIAAEELQDNFRYACWVASVPGLPCFYLLFAFHNNTWNRKIGKAFKRGRPGSIHHMTSGGCEVDMGGAQMPKQCTGPSVRALYHVFQTPDLSVMESTRLDRQETRFQV